MKSIYGDPYALFSVLVLAAASSTYAGCSGDAPRAQANPAAPQSGTASEPGSTGEAGPSVPSRVDDPVRQVPSGPSLETSGLAQDYVLVPGGRQLHKSCVHEIPAGGRLLGNGDIVVHDQIVAHTPACDYPAKPLPGGHVAQPPPGAQGQYGFPAEVQIPSNEDYYGFDWFNGLEVEFVVPPPPTTTLGPAWHIALWPALADPFYVLQPVLSWGLAGNYGNFSTWNMANWYCDQNYLQGSCWYGNVTAVNVGDDIDTWVGIDSGSACNRSGTGCGWWVEYTTNWGAWQSTLVGGVVSAPHLVDIGVIETYNVSRCNQLPNASGIWFLNNGIYMPTTDWSTFGWLNPQSYMNRENGTGNFAPAWPALNFTGDCSFTFRVGSASGQGTPVDGWLGWNPNQ